MLVKKLPDYKLVVLLGDVPDTTNVVIQAIWVYCLKLSNPESISNHGVDDVIVTADE